MVRFVFLLNKKRLGTGRASLTDERDGEDFCPILGRSS